MSGFDQIDTSLNRKPVCRHVRSVVALIAVNCGLIGLAILLPAVLADSTTTAAADKTAIDQRQMQVPENGDYSKFRHDGAYHARLPCLLCHRRENNSARPSLPGGNQHAPCAGCHEKQFANSSGPICTICHTDAPSGKLKSFPPLRSFNMKFDHARHSRMGDLSCTTCHRPSRGGVALSIPRSFNAHTVCFRCHTPNAKSSDRDIASCAVCHQRGRPSRVSETAPAFRVGFNHAKHNQGEKLTCNDCHRIRAGVAQRLQVSAPQPLHHHASPNSLSCMSCHDGKKAFGGDDFSVCQRCHTRPTWHF